MKKYLVFLGIYGILFQVLLTFFVFGRNEEFVAVKMLWSLILFWIVVCGYLMHFYRDNFSRFFNNIKLKKLILFTAKLKLIKTPRSRLLRLLIMKLRSPNTGFIATFR